MARRESEARGIRALALAALLGLGLLVLDLTPTTADPSLTHKVVSQVRRQRPATGGAEAVQPNDRDAQQGTRNASEQIPGESSAAKFTPRHRAHRQLPIVEIHEITRRR